MGLAVTLLLPAPQLTSGVIMVLLVLAQGVRLAVLEAEPNVSIAYSADLGGFAPVEPVIDAVLRAALRAVEKLGATVEEACPDLPELAPTYLTLRAMLWAALPGRLPHEIQQHFKRTLRENIEYGRRLTAAQTPLSQDQPRLAVLRVHLQGTEHQRLPLLVAAILQQQRAQGPQRLEVRRRLLQYPEFSTPAKQFRPGRRLLGSAHGSVRPGYGFHQGRNGISFMFSQWQYISRDSGNRIGRWSALFIDGPILRNRFTFLSCKVKLPASNSGIGNIKHHWGISTCWRGH